MADLIQIRRDTYDNWWSTNPTLANGEVGIITHASGSGNATPLNPLQCKVGDGSTTWRNLATQAWAEPGLSGSINQRINQVSGSLHTEVNLMSGSLESLEDNIGHYTCNDQGITVAKTVSAPNYTRITGGAFKVKFNYKHTATSGTVTLKVGNAAAANLYYDGAPVTNLNTWGAGETVDVYFDGQYYMANNVSGGGTFANGEKVKDVGIDSEPTAGSDNLVKSGGVYDKTYKEVYIDLSLTDSVDGKFVSDSGNLGSQTGTKVYYISCQAGDKFKFKYSGPIASSFGGRAWAIYSVSDISQASSSNVLSKGAPLNANYFVAGTEYTININNSSAQLLVFTQYVKGAINMVPSVTQRQYKSLVEVCDGLDNKIDVEVTFASGQKVKETHIVDNTTTPSATDVLSARRGWSLSQLLLRNNFCVDEEVQEITLSGPYSASTITTMIPYLGKNTNFIGVVTTQNNDKVSVHAVNKATGTQISFMDSTAGGGSFTRPRPDLEFINLRLQFSSTSVGGTYTLTLKRTDKSINDKIQEVKDYTTEHLKPLTEEVCYQRDLSLIELTDSVDGKYIGVSGTLGSGDNTFKVWYLNCRYGDKFRVRFEGTAPSSSGAVIYAIYKTNDISQASSSTLSAVSNVTLNNIVIGQDYIVEITDLDAKMICFQQFVSGLVDVQPIVSGTINELLQDDLTTNELSEVEFEYTSENEMFLEEKFITDSGNIGTSNTFGVYKVPCKKGDVFKLFTFKPISTESTAAFSYAIYSSETTLDSSTKLVRGGYSAIGIRNITITQDNAKMLAIGVRVNSNYTPYLIVSDIHLFKYNKAFLPDILNSDISNVKTDGGKVHFSYGHDLIQTDIRTQFDFTENTPLPQYYNLTGITSLMYQLQDKMDELMAANTDYITKFDAVTFVGGGLEYPEYANGIETAGTYLVTPAYKVYGYKLSYTNIGVNGKSNRPTKILITGSIHGDEQSASLNLYSLAKDFCNNYLTDIDVFKARGAFEIYLVPCINGYSSIHRNRLNANGVNINRNFPVVGWENQGSGTPGNGQYRGPSAGSEFETQLIMALVNKIKPDMLFDAHSYPYNEPLNFFTDISGENQVRMAYDCLSDISFTLKKDLPLYYGTNYGLVKGDATHQNSEHAPAEKTAFIATVPYWSYHNVGVPFAATIEICGGIPYYNGVIDPHVSTLFSEEAYQVAEYTMKNQLLRYGEYVSNHIVSTRYWEWNKIS